MKGSGWVLRRRAAALWLSRSRISFGLSGRSELKVWACFAGLPPPPPLLLSPPPLACSLLSRFPSSGPPGCGPASGTGPGDTRLAPPEPSEPSGDTLLSFAWLLPLALATGR